MDVSHAVDRVWIGDLGVHGLLQVETRILAMFAIGRSLQVEVRCVVLANWGASEVSTYLQQGRIFTLRLWCKMAWLTLPFAVCKLNSPLKDSDELYAKSKVKAPWYCPCCCDSDWDICELGITTVRISYASCIVSLCGVGTQHSATCWLGECCVLCWCTLLLGRQCETPCECVHTCIRSGQSSL